METLHQAGPQTHAAGFTLVEVAVVLAVAVLLAAITLPSLQAQLMKSRRSDAVAALTQLQLAQERYHAHHGLYASQLQVLIGASSPRSEQGLYDIALFVGHADGYRAMARARADGAQAADSACSEIVLSVAHGFAEHAPSRQCWGR